MYSCQVKKKYLGSGCVNPYLNKFNIFLSYEYINKNFNITYVLFHKAIQRLFSKLNYLKNLKKDGKQINLSISVSQIIKIQTSFLKLIQTKKLCYKEYQKDLMQFAYLSFFHEIISGIKYSVSEFDVLKKDDNWIHIFYFLDRSKIFFKVLIEYEFVLLYCIVQRYYYTIYNK